MIEIKDTVFHLKTNQTSYLFFVNEHRHLEHVHYGYLLEGKVDIEALKRRYAFELGSATSYDETDRGYMLNHLLLETSSYGKGDYRLPMIHAENTDGVRSTDFLYESHEILTNYTVKSMPQSRKNKTLKITLKDHILNLTMNLFYSVFETENVITRHVEVTNTSTLDVTLDRLYSLNLDMDYHHQTLIKLDGAWIREKHIERHSLTKGIVTIDSKKGVSSADHNPAFVLEGNDGYTGLILVYSGNFEANFEVTPHDLLRVTFGINSFDFRYRLSPQKTFIGPEVVLSHHSSDLNQLSQQFHQFINQHLIPVSHQKTRPIVINNWEATYFDFNEKKILAIAKKAKQLGMELLCLDDGWFGHRDDDTSSLGDWHEHPKKLKKGLSHLIKKIKAIGLDVGLWFEPEMISKESELYQNHPDWAVQIPGVSPSIGRHQMMLDLTQKVVRDNIVKQLSDVLESHDISYVKWDHNRNSSDAYSTNDCGAFNVQMTLGVYDIISRLTSRFPSILFESCASGGNRADLGMMAYMPQTWTSDNTDPFERLRIQAGAGLFYPLSNMSNHVASEVSHQMFRLTPLETRFNVACFGVLGYELDVTKLTPFDEKIIAKQTAFYKEHRALFQFGTFIQIPHDHYTVWAVSNDQRDEAIVLVYQEQMMPNPGFRSIKIPFLCDGAYEITTREQFFNIRAFGSLVNEALPVQLTVNSTVYNTIANRYLFKANSFKKRLSNHVLKHHGLPLPHEFTSTGYNEAVMVLPDHYSYLFIIKKIKEINK
jgi:alpha-galactosidase